MYTHPLRVFFSPFGNKKFTFSFFRGETVLAAENDSHRDQGRARSHAQVSADDMRKVNLWYMQTALLPMERVPGFLGHQTERSRVPGVDNATALGAPLCSKRPRRLSRCAIRNHASRCRSVFSRETHTLEPGLCALVSLQERERERVVDHAGNELRDGTMACYRRDWDLLGHPYSLMSQLATAGLNLVLCMIPARDLAEPHPATRHKSHKATTVLFFLATRLALFRSGGGGGRDSGGAS